MNKIETLDYIKKEKGFVPYVVLFDIFNDEDDIPQNLIDMSIRNEPNENFIIGNKSLIEILDSIGIDIKKK